MVVSIVELIMDHAQPKNTNSKETALQYVPGILSPNMLTITLNTQSRALKVKSGTHGEVGATLTEVQNYHVDELYKLGTQSMNSSGSKNRLGTQSMNSTSSPH